MENVQLDFRFDYGSENEFIYNFGVNRGHSLTYSKVTRCLFLSAEAKQLYQCICEYAYNGRRDCFPSQNMLMLHLGWSRPTLITYTKELVDAGLLEVVSNGVGQNNVYKLIDLHKVKVLRHSEMVYLVLSNFEGRDWLKAVNEYKKSEAFQAHSLNPYLEQIEEWFNNFFSGTSDKRQSQPKPEAPVARWGIPPKEAADAKRESDPDAPERKKTPRIGWRDKPVSEWNANDFASYYEHKYIEVFKLPCAPTTIKERGALATFLKRFPDTELLKKKMDVYLESPQFNPKSIFHFCSGYVQGLIDHFLLTGSWDTAKKTSLAPRADSQETINEYERLFERNLESVRGDNH